MPTHVSHAAASVGPVLTDRCSLGNRDFKVVVIWKVQPVAYGITCSNTSSTRLRSVAEKDNQST